MSINTNSSYLLSELLSISLYQNTSFLLRIHENVKKWRPNDETVASHHRILKHLYDFNEYLLQAKLDFCRRYNQNVRNTNDLYQLEDFTFLRTLGKGTFGRVMYAQHTSLSFYCAMKLLEKRQIIKFKQVAHLRNEIDILSAMNFPFVAVLLFYFISNVYVCLGLPFYDGGDMFKYLRRIGHFEENEAQFYAGQVVLAFEYLHYLGIVYRDLKPENILFSQNGYLKLVDFGFAKKIDDSRTYSLCGTPDYLAPEILKGKGYGKTVDWWSFGILVFEMTAGQPPFYDVKIMRTYDKIMKGNVKYPLHFSRNLKNFLEHIIIVDTTKRYGVLKNGILDIKYHDWFRHFRWDELFQQKLKSYKPAEDSIHTINIPDQHISNPLRTTDKFEYNDEFKDFQ